MKNDAITVSIKGLAKLLERKGTEWVALELIQNAWDTQSGSVSITLAPIPGKPMAELVVTDEDPEGFVDLSHAWTLFAESTKKDNPEQRGRFNIGEKHVIAYCLAYGGSVTVSTTTGTVVFDKDGRRNKRAKRESGSEVRCVMRLTRAQLADMTDAIHRLIAPVQTTLNGKSLLVRVPRATLDVILPTEIADEEGVLKRTKRKTTVKLYPRFGAETASIYEMGIPVVETGDEWHYDVGQKVPLNMERDNVPPAFLRALRVAVLNAAYEELLTKHYATKPWVDEALAHPDCLPEAVEHVMDLRYGEKRVIADPSDPEATKRAVARGYTVVPSGSLNKGQWANVRSSGAIKPAGHVMPTPKPYSPDGTPETLIPREEWTDAMLRVVKYAEAVGRVLTGRKPRVRLVREPQVWWSANYGEGSLALNYGRLGKHWFNDDSPAGQERVDRLLIHEFAHDIEGDHLSKRYNDALCEMGAKLARWKANDKATWRKKP